MNPSISMFLFHKSIFYRNKDLSVKGKILEIPQKCFCCEVIHPLVHTKANNHLTKISSLLFYFKPKILKFFLNYFFHVSTSQPDFNIFSAPLLLQQPCNDIKTLFSNKLFKRILLSQFYTPSRSRIGMNFSHFFLTFIWTPINIACFMFVEYLSCCHFTFTKVSCRTVKIANSKLIKMTSPSHCRRHHPACSRWLFYLFFNFKLQLIWLKMQRNFCASECVDERTQKSDRKKVRANEINIHGCCYLCTVSFPH